MEQCTIIIALLHQLHEIVTMDGSLVIEANYDVAQHCLYLYFHVLYNFGCKGTEKSSESVLYGRISNNL